MPGPESTASAPQPHPAAPRTAPAPLPEDHAGAAKLMGELARDLEIPPFEGNFPIANFRDLASARIEAELARATAGNLIQPAEQIAAARPVNLASLSTKVSAIRGAHHVEKEVVGQDFGIVRRMDNCIVAALSDGSSAAPFSALGARIVAVKAADFALSAFGPQSSFASPIDREFLWSLTSGIYEELSSLCEESKSERKEALSLTLSATLHILVLTPTTATHLALGDGYLRDGNHRDWTEVEALAPRTGILCNPADPVAPPFPAAPFGFAPEYESLRETRDSAVLPPAPDVHKKMRHLAAMEEALCFRILSHTSAASALERPIQIATDGRYFCDAGLDGVPFPLDEALRLLDEPKLRTAAALWNLAARRWNEEEKKSTLCPAGCLLDLLYGNDPELCKELVTRLPDTAIGKWLPKRREPSLHGVAEDLRTVLLRAVKNEPLRAVVAQHAAPIGRALLEPFWAANGLPPIPADGRPLQQIYDDLTVVTVERT